MRPEIEEGRLYKHDKGRANKGSDEGGDGAEDPLPPGDSISQGTCTHAPNNASHPHTRDHDQRTHSVPHTPTHTHTHTHPLTLTHTLAHTHTHTLSSSQHNI